MQKAISRRKFLKYGLYGGAAWGLAGALLPGGCSGRGKKQRPNVVIVSVDTLRADHVSCYGYNSRGRLTPNIDRLANRGTRFTNAYTTMPTTLPAHGSLMSSLYPSQLATRRNGERILQGVQSLAEILQAAGYNTAAFVSAVVLDGHYGLNQGFVTYEDISTLNARLVEAAIEKMQQRRRDSKLDGRMNADRDLMPYNELPKGGARPAEQTVEQAQAWLQKNKKDNFFLFIHLYDPHTPYYAPEHYRMRFGAPDTPVPNELAFVKDKSKFTPKINEEYIAAYDAEIAYADWAIGRLTDQLEKLGLNDNTIVVLLSDHGETLDELLERYGYAFDHGEFLYAHQLHIPLIIRMPQALGPGYKPGTVCDTPVSIIDVMPTVLNALAVETFNPMMGSSLLPVLRGRTVTPRSIFSERRTFGNPRPLLQGNDYSIIEKQWHLIYSTIRQAELYNISADPLEFVDVLPTILNALAVKTENPMMGVSLLPALCGQAVTPRPIFSERRAFKNIPKPYLTGNDYSIIEKQWHLIYSTIRQAELYNISADPLEFVDLAADSTVAATLSGKVQQWAEQLKPMFGPGVFETDKQAIERLRSLGYVE